MTTSYQEPLPILKLRCRMCDHEWVPRTPKASRQCPNPNCRSRLWYRLKKVRGGNKAASDA